jgi:hypothetical protein
MHRVHDRSREQPNPSAAISGNFCDVGNLAPSRGVSYSQSPDDRMRARIDLPPIAIAESFQMTLTVAHISPIMSLIAGALILIMPRLLNYIVALFLILNGLLGLGLLRWLHL